MSFIPDGYVKIDFPAFKADAMADDIVLCGDAFRLKGCPAPGTDKPDARVCCKGFTPRSPFCLGGRNHNILLRIGYARLRGTAYYQRKLNRFGLTELKNVLQIAK